MLFSATRFIGDARWCLLFIGSGVSSCVWCQSEWEIDAQLH